MPRGGIEGGGGESDMNLKSQDLKTVATTFTKKIFYRFCKSGEDDASSNLRRSMIGL